MKRFRWAIFYISAALLIILLTTTTYLGAITLPSRLRGLVTDEIENATGKKVLIRSMRFEILKGLVLDDLVLYDNTSIIIRASEVDSGFLIPPVFRKRIIIPTLSIESPSILLERRADNSFNLSDIIPRCYAPKNGVTIDIFRIVIKHGVVNFTDKTLSPPFTEIIENADVRIGLSLPDKITFDLRCEIPTEQPMEIRSQGQYLPCEKELIAQVTVKDISPDEFIDYYRASGISFPGGLLDANIGLRVKESVVNADIDVSTKGLSVFKDKMTARLDSKAKAMIQYDTGSREIEYAGNLYIKSMDITGVDTVGKLENIKARVEFNDSRVSSDNITADVFGIPWKARINLINFANPIFDLYAVTETRLSILQKILADNFNIRLPTDIAGKSSVSLAVQIEPDNPPKLNGYVEMSDAIISMGSSNFPIEHINGKAQFTLNNLTWESLSLVYHGRTYKASGALTNFAAPGVRLDVASKEVSFRSVFAVVDKLIKLTQLSGRYYGSAISAAGQLNLGDQDRIEADINGLVEFRLEDLSDIFRSSAEMPKAKPAGSLNVKFALNGDIKDIKNCRIDAKGRGERISLYGMEFTGLMFDYTQKDGAGVIKSANSSFYGGAFSATGRVGWARKEVPYSFTLNIKDAKLEKYKKDTDFKDKDLAGDIKLYANLNGSFKDASALAGLGKISIAKGRLWQLDLFKGLGSLIFTSDFSDIVFAEGSCDFKIKDKAFYTNNISLKSYLLNLYGRGALGFDKSVNALLTSELAEDAMYPGLRKNIATAVGKGTEIEVSGTLNNPIYKMKPNVSGIVESVTNVFLQQ